MKPTCATAPCLLTSRRIFVLCFSVLCLLKTVGVIQESAYPWYEVMPVALAFAATFGSPQLICAFACRKAQFSGGQKFIASLAVMAFIGTSVVFGAFPGVERPHWGGQGHFEVPIAFAMEWLIAGVLLFAFRTKKT